MLAHLGLGVTRLIRTAYGPFQLGALPRGAVEEVNPKVLRDQLGMKTETPAQERLRKVKADARADRFLAGAEQFEALGKVESTEEPVDDETPAPKPTDEG